MNENIQEYENPYVKFTLNIGFSKQSILNYSTEVEANQHILAICIFVSIHTHKFSNIKYTRRMLMNIFLAIYIAKVLEIQ